MSDSMTFLGAACLSAPPAQAHAAWAIKPRGPAHAITVLLTSAIIRMPPAALRGLAFLLCAASVAGMLFLAALAAA
jgi:hypothetical protein